MCLYIDQDSIRRTEAQRAENKVRTVWKVMDHVEGPGGWTLNSVCYCHRWDPGVHESSREQTALRASEEYNGRINIGFHVFLSKETIFARNYVVTLSDKIVPLEAHDEDLVAIGDEGSLGEAVYTRFTLTQAAYDAAMGRETADSSAERRS